MAPMLLAWFRVRAKARARVRVRVRFGVEARVRVRVRARVRVRGSRPGWGYRVRVRVRVRGRVRVRVVEVAVEHLVVDELDARAATTAGARLRFAQALLRPPDTDAPCKLSSARLPVRRRVVIKWLCTANLQQGEMKD